MGWYWTQDKPALKTRQQTERENEYKSASLQPIFSVFVSSDGHITVSLSRSRINSKFSSEISLYISAWSHFYITITRKYLLHICVLNLHVKAKAAVNYLNPFPIQVKACDHHSFCKVLLLLPVKRMNPFKCCYSYNSILYLPVFAKIHHSF
jgi:hypothetical protein